MTFLSLLGQASNDYYTNQSLYDSTYYTTSAGDTAALAGFMAFMLTFGLIIAAASYVVSAFLLSRIFKKAGIEEWKAWVPVYNSWIFLELGDQKGFWAILSLIPGINFVAVIFMLIAAYNIGLNFQKESWFVLLAIFVPVVWLVWLAFDSSTWKGMVVTKTATAAPSTTPPATPKPPATPTSTPKA